VTDTASMRARVPAQSVIEELLRRQNAAPPRSSLSRLFGRSPLLADTVTWYVAAQGEMHVGAILAQLPPEWATFHALPIGTQSADIDHLVVGPGGIFTINTKHHRGKAIRLGKHSMFVNGRPVPHLQNAEAEAERVTTLLRERMPLLPPVQPVIALVEPLQIAIDEKPGLVKVVDARELPRWLAGLSVMLSEPELDEVVDILDDPGTWAPTAAAPTLSADELMGRFADLDAQVHRAKARRVTWTIVGCAALAAITGITLSQVAMASVIAG
jgi:Nuclease-related domain